MVQIIDLRDTKKTKKLLNEAVGNRGLVVCKNPAHMKEKAEAYGLYGLTYISYTDYMSFPSEYLDCKIYIDEIEEFLKTKVPNLEGYTLTLNN